MNWFQIDIIELDEIVGVSAVKGRTKRSGNLVAARCAFELNVILYKKREVFRKSIAIEAVYQCFNCTVTATETSGVSMRDDTQTELKLAGDVWHSNLTG